MQAFLHMHLITELRGFLWNGLNDVSILFQPEWSMHQGYVIMLN